MKDLPNGIKVLKKLTTAIEAADPANGGSGYILSVRNGAKSTYLIPQGDAYGMTDIGLIPVKDGKHDCYSGHIITKHLNRLGNGNWATPRPPTSRDSRPMLWDNKATEPYAKLLLDVATVRGQLSVNAVATGQGQQKIMASLFTVERVGEGQGFTYSVSGEPVTVDVFVTLIEAAVAAYNTKVAELYDTKAK